MKAAFMAMPTTTAYGIVCGTSSAGGSAILARLRQTSQPPHPWVTDLSTATAAAG
ncbi:hypothetical protein AB0D57_43340 [Streptomyces sp. NPDC048275]|uniref:hypothetical protein n=1 Tax=Streptomyces sp. NPDC048275 TaxID=3155629 RepID=UPI0034104528